MVFSSPLLYRGHCLSWVSGGVGARFPSGNGVVSSCMRGCLADLIGISRLSAQC